MTRAFTDEFIEEVAEELDGNYCEIDEAKALVGKPVELSVHTPYDKKMTIGVHEYPGGKYCYLDGVEIGYVEAVRRPTHYNPEGGE